MGMQLTGKGSLVASSLTAIGASVCCVGPLVLLALGVGGTWVGALTMMEPLRPLFIGLTLLFLGLAFRKLYLVPQVCTPGTPCADPRTLAFTTLVTVAIIGLGSLYRMASLREGGDTVARQMGGTLVERELAPGLRQRKCEFELAAQVGRGRHGCMLLRANELL